MTQIENKNIVDVVWACKNCFNDMSQQWYRELAKAGHCPRPDNNKIDLLKAFIGLLAFLVPVIIMIINGG